MLRRDVAVDLQYSVIAVALGGLAAGNDNLSTVFCAMDDGTVPSPLRRQSCFHLFDRNGPACLQQFSDVLSDGLFTFPSIDGLGAGIPESDSPLVVTNDNRF